MPLFAFIFFAAFFLCSFYSYDALSQDNKDVVVDFGVLKGMNNYTPPPMFGVPEKPSLEKENLNLEIITEPSAVKPAYKIPPKPKRKPDKFKVSSSMIKTIRARQEGVSQTSSSGVIKRIKAEMPKKQSSVMDITENDLGQDIIEMDASDILESIDITEIKNDDDNLGFERNRPKIVPPDEDTPLTIIFRPEETALDHKSSKTMLESVLPSLKNNQNATIEIVAFASALPNAPPNTARRLSLTRALAVRSALMAHEIQEQRVIIKALGATEDGKPPDRLEIYLK
jgi:outer membrane protein OmpA-like peptidoglycan-associated protein